MLDSELLGQPCLMCFLKDYEAPTERISNYSLYELSFNCRQITSSIILNNLYTLLSFRYNHFSEMLALFAPKSRLKKIKTCVHPCPMIKHDVFGNLDNFFSTFFTLYAYLYGYESLKFSPKDNSD